MITFELPFCGVLFFEKNEKQMMNSRKPNHLLEMTQKTGT